MHDLNGKQGTELAEVIVQKIKSAVNTPASHGKRIDWAVPNHGENGPEVMELATVHFDGGGQSPGPVTAACIVELSDGTFDQAVKRFDRGPTTPLSGKR